MKKAKLGLLLMLVLLLLSAEACGSHGKTTRSGQPAAGVVEHQSNTPETAVDTDKSTEAADKLLKENNNLSPAAAEDPETDVISIRTDSGGGQYVNENLSDSSEISAGKTRESDAAAEEPSAGKISVENQQEEHEHSYVMQVQREADCTTKGLRVFTCSCGESYSEVIPAIGHMEEEIPAVAATCTQDGLTAGKRCIVCGTVTVPQSSVTATGHTPAAEMRTVTVYAVFCHGKIDENHHCCVAWFYSRVSTEDAVAQWMVHSDTAHDGDAGYTVTAPSVEEEATGRTICTVCGAVL